MNPQTAHGEDLMSRISYVMMHPEAPEILTSAIQRPSMGSLWSS
ncbi:MAG: hypothetical protein CM15mP84_00490 [Cellvibrionales bacterium]|nr:MAG: hypothetical protein CM15mP84_00490 [Cellvibrionales bacterium]